MFEFPTMLQIFQDAAHQDRFEREGYIVLPFFNAHEIKGLTELYQRIQPKEYAGFYPSSFSNDKEYRTTADREIRAYCERSIAAYFQDVKVICGCYIVKKPVAESAMCVHQDMTLVDESKYTGVNIWVPMIDLHDQNGTLQVLPRSHRLYPTYRGSSIKGMYETCDEEVKKYMLKLYPRAGEAVIFDQSIIHYSTANESGAERIVTNTYLTHKDATFRTAYYQPDYGNKVELFEQGETFMTDFEQFGQNIQDRPKIGKSLGLVDYGFPTLNAASLAAKYGVVKPQGIKRFLQLIGINGS